MPDRYMVLTGGNEEEIRSTHALGVSGARSHAHEEDAQACSRVCLIRLSVATPLQA